MRALLLLLLLAGAPARGATTVIDRARLDATPARTLLDLIELYVPGASWLHTPGGATLAVRGFVDDRMVLYAVRVDGRRVEPGAWGGDQLELMSWRLEDLERVVVRRGPDAVTAGDAAGGTIDLYTRDAASAPGGAAGLAYTSAYDATGLWARYGARGLGPVDVFGFAAVQVTPGDDDARVYTTHAEGGGHVGVDLGPAGRFRSNTPTRAFADADGPPPMKGQLTVAVLDDLVLRLRYVRAGRTTLAPGDGAFRAVVDGLAVGLPETRTQQLAATAAWHRALTDRLTLGAEGGYVTTDVRQRAPDLRTRDLDDLTAFDARFAAHRLYARTEAAWRVRPGVRVEGGAGYARTVFTAAWGRGADDGLRLGPVVGPASSEAVGTGPGQVSDATPGGLRVGTGFVEHAVDAHLRTAATPAAGLDLGLGGRIRRASNTAWLFTPGVDVRYALTAAHALEARYHEALRAETAERRLDGVRRSARARAVEAAYVGAAPPWGLEGRLTGWLTDREILQVGDQRLAGVEVEAAWRQGPVRVGASHALVAQLDFALDAGQSRSGVSYADYAYPLDAETTLTATGDAPNNVPDQTTRLWADVQLALPVGTLALHADLRAEWGRQGAFDGLTTVRRTARALATIEGARDAGAHLSQARLGARVAWTLDPWLTVAVRAADVPLLGDDARYLYDPGHTQPWADGLAWIEEPATVGADLTVRF